MTGFICDTMREMLADIEKVGSLDRRACRDHVERRFTPEVMVAGYEEIYTSVTQQRGDLWPGYCDR